MHALQGLSELDPEATITSVDGVSACDMISRSSMLEVLRQLPGGGAAFPFVRMFQAAFQNVSGRTISGLCTGLHKERAASKEML